MPIPFMRDVQAKARIVTGDGEFLVVANGDIAKELNAIGAKTPVLIEGNLVMYRWRTEDGTEHTRMEIHADKVSRGR